MPKVIAVNIDRLADRMVTSHTLNHVSSKYTDASRFFMEANNSKLQGNALIAYFSRLRQWPTKSYIVENLMRTISTTPDIALEAQVFAKELNKLYPRSLAKRLSILAHGGVDSAELRPVSKINKMLIMLDQKFNSCKSEITKFVNS